MSNVEPKNLTAEIAGFDGNPSFDSNAKPVSDTKSYWYNCGLDEFQGTCNIYGNTNGQVRTYDFVGLYKQLPSENPKAYVSYFYVSNTKGKYTKLPWGTGYYVAYVTISDSGTYRVMAEAGPT